MTYSVCGEVRYLRYVGLLFFLFSLYLYYPLDNSDLCYLLLRSVIAYRMQGQGNFVGFAFKMMKHPRAEV
jgi:hypothetical protein